MPPRTHWFPAPRTARWLVGACALVAGCHAAPAEPYAPGPCEPVRPRGLVLARQVAADTALALAGHPLQSTWDNLCELTDHLGGAADGVVCKRVALHLREPPELPCPPAPAEDAAGCPPADPGLRPAQVRLLPGGAEALAALDELIDQATCRIDVLIFYWENDAVGADLAARLAARAGPHRRVRVLLDGGGNLVFAKEKYAPDGRVHRVVSEMARNPYVEVRRIRNPFARFDHRKLVLVDGRAAWTGGRNFTRNSFFKHHDLSYTLAGPLVGELQARYDAYWEEQGSGNRDQGSGIRDQEVGSGDCSPDPGSPIPDPWELIPEANAYGRLVFTDPGHPEIERALYRAIDGARHHVYLENVYFSDSRLVCKLARARRRGVDVRAVLTFTTENDTFERANRVVANRLLKAGVRVYVYPIMTHVKAAAVDGCWAYLGSGNFDALSLRHNHEMGLVIGAGPLLPEVEERLFRTDFQPEWELKGPVPVTWKAYLSEVLASLAL